MRAVKFIEGHVIYNPAYTYKFQPKTIIELINNVVAQEQEEVKVGNLQKPLEFYDTVIKGRSMLLPSNSNHSDLLVLFNIYRSG